MSSDPNRVEPGPTAAHPADAQDSGGRIGRLAGLPVLLLFLAIVTCRWAGLDQVYEHAALRLFLSSTFYTVLALGTIVLVARSFLASGAAGLLLLECGVVLWSLAGTVGDLVFHGNANIDITIFNVSILLAAICHVTGAALTLGRRRAVPARAAWLAFGLALSLLALGLVTWAALTARLPIFFLQGHGGTPVRFVVLTAAIVMFLLSAGLLRAGGRARIGFISWYSLALLSMSVGLFGIMIQSALGDLVNWLSRTAQWLGGVYLFAAAVSSVREAGAWQLPSDTTEIDRPASVWDERLLRTLAIGRLWSLSPAVRYALAIVFIAAATALRRALVPWMGAAAVFNIAFAANVATTLLVGIGPGLLSVPLGIVGAELFVMGSLPSAFNGEALLRMGVSTAVGALIVCVVHAVRAAQVAAGRSEARLAAFAAATFEGVVESEAGRIVDCNDQFARMAGYAPSELRGMLLSDLVVPEDRERGTATLRENRNTVGEYVAQRKDGTRFTVETHGHASAPGNVRRFTAVRDITARKALESERARNVLQHQLALDSARMGWWHYDPVSRVATWDDRYREIFGVSGYTRLNDEILAQLIHPDDLPGLWARVEAALDPASHLPYASEYRIVRPDGATRWVEAHGLATFEGEGAARHATSLVGTVADITDRKLAAEVIERERQNLQRMFDVVNVGLLLVDGHGAVTRVNQTMSKWLGKDLSALLGAQPGDVVGCFHALSNPGGCGHAAACSDCPVRHAFESVLRTGESVHDVEAEAKLVIDGRNVDVWFDVSADPLMLESERYALVAMNNISARMQAEEALRESEEQVRAIFDHSMDAVILSDPAREGQIIAANPAAYRMLGWDASELIGRGRDVLLDPADPVVENLISERERTGASQTELKLHRKDGSTFPGEMSTSRFFDRKGDPRVVTIIRDISDRRRAEQSLRESEEKYRSLFMNMTEEVHFWKIVRNPDGTIKTWTLVDANPPSLASWGVATIEEIRGRTTDEIFGPGSTDHYLPIVQTVVEKGTPHVYEDFFSPLDKFFRFTTVGFGEHFITTGADITAIKKAEQSLRQLNAELEGRVAERTAEVVSAAEKVRTERQRFLDVLETLPVIIDIIRPDHRVEWANRACREALGDNQGRLCYAAQFGRTTPCEECQAFTPLQTGRPHHWEWTLPSGRTFDIHNFPFADADGSPMILEMDIDITDRRAADAALRRASAYNRRLIEASVDPLVTIGADGRVTDVNVATETVTGRPREALIGTDFSDYFTEPTRARESYQQVFREGVVRDYPLEIRSRDGGLTPVLYNATVYRDQDGQVAGVFAAAHDVTERRRSERALAERAALIERQADQLRALATELAQTEQRERQRLARILHDNIQQLLVAAQIQLNLIKRANPKVIRSTVEGVTGILAETLEASRSLTVELCPPVLHQSGLAAALTWLAARLEQKQQFKVHLRADNAAEPASPDERAFLFEATREILLNATKHSGAREADVTMVRTPDDCCHIIVEDHGAGFDPASIKPGPVGGFGLFSIQQRLLYMGGQLTIESSPGQGTRAELTIAVRRRAAPVVEPGAAPPGGAAAPVSFRPKAKKITVLLVDDHRMMRQGLSSLLQFENDIEVVAEAENGQQAVEVARQCRPDVVVMDVNMPVMNGVEATRILTREMPAVKIVALSMHLDTDVANAIRAAGAVAYLTKGGPSGDLVAAIRACATVGTGGGRTAQG